MFRAAGACSGRLPVISRDIPRPGADLSRPAGPAPGPAGGGQRAVDVVARLASEKMSATLGQRFYVENQPGAAGLLGMRAGARAAPDGYTVVVANDSVITMLPNMKADAGYDRSRPSCRSRSWSELIAHPTLPA